jgi:hypothetical protein
VVNAGFRVKDADDHWSVVIWSKNLSNNLYAASYRRRDLVDPESRSWATRAAGITLNKKF